MASSRCLPGKRTSSPTQASVSSLSLAFPPLCRDTHTHTHTHRVATLGLGRSEDHQRLEGREKEGAEGSEEDKRPLGSAISSLDFGRRSAGERKKSGINEVVPGTQA